MKKSKASGAASFTVSERDFRRLQELSFKARRTGGAKLPTSAIVRALVLLMQRLDVDLKGVRSRAELGRRLRQAKLRRGEGVGR